MCLAEAGNWLGSRRAAPGELVAAAGDEGSGGAAAPSELVAGAGLIALPSRLVHADELIDQGGFVIRLVRKARSSCALAIWAPTEASNPGPRAPQAWASAAASPPR